MVAEPSRTATTPRVETHALTPAMAELVSGITAAVDASADPAQIAPAAAAALRAALPAGASLLTSGQCLPDCKRYCQHVAYVDPRGRFSVVSLVWLPGQVTPIHDHACWCVVGVVLGREEETRFVPVGSEPAQDAKLRRTGQVHNEAGAVCWLIPASSGREVQTARTGPETPRTQGISPVSSGDIHQVRAVSDGVTISIHVYGDDIAARGSSIRRVYAEERLEVSGSAHPAPPAPADGAARAGSATGPTVAG